MPNLTKKKCYIESFHIFSNFDCYVEDFFFFDEVKVKVFIAGNKEMRSSKNN